MGINTNCQPVIGLKMLVVGLVTLFSLSACQQYSLPKDFLQEKRTEQKPLITDLSIHFGERPYIPSPDEIHELPTELAEDLLAYMSDSTNSRTKPHNRFFNYLQSRTESFEYLHETLDARETLARSAGNCLSLAILTTALAKVAGLEIGYQLITASPVYEVTQSVVNEIVHIRSIIYDPDWNPNEGVFVFTKSGVQVDYFPTQKQRFIANINEDKYFSRYYQNIAAEALLSNDLNRAYWYAIEALKYHPDNAPAINILGVINRRGDALVNSEQLFLYGIQYSEDKLLLLKNYRFLLEENGRIEEAEYINKQLGFMAEPSPIDWYLRAQASYHGGEYSKAITYYNRSLELAPYLHEAHLGIAQANYELGHITKAKLALESALENVVTQSTFDLYEAKLVSLRNEIYQ